MAAIAQRGLVQSFWTSQLADTGKGRVGKDPSFGCGTCIADIGLDSPMDWAIGCKKGPARMGGNLTRAECAAREGAFALQSSQTRTLTPVAHRALTDSCKVWEADWQVLSLGSC